MNIKYLKRQFTLQDLGLKLSDDVQKMYDYLSEIIESLDDIVERDCVERYNKGDETILYITYESEIFEPYFSLKEDIFNHIADEFLGYRHSDFENTQEILSFLLNKILNKDIKITYPMAKISLEYYE